MVKPGYKETEIGVIPEDWEVKELRQICLVNPPNNTTELSNSKDFIYIDLECVCQGKLTEIKYVKKENAPSRAKRRFQIHDTLYQTVRPYQGNNLYITFEPYRHVASTGYAVLRANDDISPHFLYYLVNDPRFTTNVLDNCTGTSYPAINPKTLSKLLVVSPISKEEQQRIAEVLSDVDDMISSLEKLIEKKKAIKQGMMEQLLTGKMPLLGFEGEWHGNWTKTSIGMLLKERIVSIQTGPFGTVLKAGEYSDHGIPVISVREIREGYIRIFDDTPTISLQVYNRLNQYILEPYDLVFARKGSIDRSAIIPKDGQKYFLGSDGIRLRFNNEILSQFMLYLFQSVEIKQFLSDNSYGTTMAGLNETTIKMIPVYYPTNHSIRNKIVEIITDIAKEIEKIEEKLIKQRELKASILSQVLSGKIRIK